MMNMSADGTYRHYQPDPDLERWLLALPKTETHLHIEGCVTHEQLKRAEPERYVHEPAFWAPDFRFASFAQFNDEFEYWILPYHCTVERYQETAKHAFARCAAQGCRYVEASFHLPALTRMDTSGPELLAAMLEVVPEGLEVRLFGGMLHIDCERNPELLQAALEWQDLAGIDLHGPEDLPMDAGLPEYWLRARAVGKETKAHAGEFMPHTFVSQVLDELGVKRIQHGVRAMDDERLIDRLAREQIVLDMCPISNLKLGVAGVETMANHPLRRFLHAGVRVTVSTDDTFMFGNSLIEEYTALVQELGCTRQELVQLARHGFELPGVSPGVRARALTDLDAMPLV